MAGFLALAAPAGARTVRAGPSNYQAAVAGLAAGDVLELAAGEYARGLDVVGLVGSPEGWIVIRGPATGKRAVFLGDPGQNRNTVEIEGSSYVAIENLVLDGQDVANVDAIKARRGEKPTHHIRIESCTIVRHGATQQTVGISTKCPTWGWVIRKNRISGAGTGMYLGNSDGSDPFVAGAIEGNLVEDTVGYNLQVKHQVERPAVEGMPQGESVTILRHNVFIKGDGESPDGDRPNVLVGTFPESGAGSRDRYEIYGNVFFHNPRESLLQATGRVAIHDNIFVDTTESAIYLTDHNGPLRAAYVYHNTIHAASRGVSLGSLPREECRVAGNLIFANEPIVGEPGKAAGVEGNLVDSVANARKHVARPGTELGRIDFHPLAGRCTGPALDLSPFRAHADFDHDFDGNPKGEARIRGAYAGEGASRAWKLDRAFKDEWE
ncbi:MAG: hypothetical protein HY720_00370 [Planctomycetes bacterium]|nr:hypothetical protein [Planctomycetota bacterium]